MARLTDFDSSIPDPEEPLKPWWHPKDMSVEVRALKKTTDAVDSAVGDVIDAAFHFGSEMGEARIKARVTDKIETLLKKAEEGEILLNEALAFMATVLVEEEDYDEA